MSDKTVEAVEAVRQLIAACIEDYGDPAEWPDDEAVGGGEGGDLAVTFGHLRKARDALSELTRLQEEVKGLRGLIDAPELHDFAKGVVLEAAHQRKRWGSSHDAGKDPQDWFWLLGYLGGKALRAALDGDQTKALHHTISTAAACANWHAAITGENAEMRPGIDPADRHLTATLQGQQS